MSDTPRTDEAAIGFARLLVNNDKFSTTELINANFARQLERELAAAQKALSLVMNYPDIRIYIGSELSGIADAAMKEKE